MKKFMAFFLALIIAGCAYSADQLGGLIKDPHYGQYRDNLDGLESRYLNKKISYSEYLEQKKEIDDNYAREVREREELIHQQ